MNERSHLIGVKDFCHLCLAIDRKLNDIGKCVVYAFGVVTDWEPAQDVRVCWECNRKLHNLHYFKEQVKKARQTIENITPNQTFPAPLSKLNYTEKNFFVIEENHQNLENIQHINKDEVFADPISPSRDIKEINILKILDCDKEYKSEHIDLSDDNSNEFLMVKQEKSNYDIEILTEIKEVDVKYEVENLNKPQKYVNNKVKKLTKAREKGVKNKIKNVKSNKNQIKVVKTNQNLDFKIINPSPDELEEYRKDYFVIRKYKNKYKCVNCIAAFANDAALQTHNNKCHVQDVNAYACKLCTCRFKTEKHLNLHKSHHKNFCLYKCTKLGCHYAHHTKAVIISHVNSHDKPVRPKIAHLPGKFQCHHCSLIFPTRHKILVHLKKHQYSFYCNKCSYSSSSRSRLKIHKLTHIGPEHWPYGCGLCSSRFKTKHKLSVHLNAHYDITTPCEFCDQKFNDIYRLREHIKLKHQTSNIAVQKNTPKDQSYECDVCAKIFYKKGGLRRHMILHFGLKNYICAICNKAFDYSNLYFAHKRVHKDELQCYICHKVFKQMTSLTTHMALHFDERNNRCDICNRTFKSYSGLYIHKRDVHNGERRYQCDICGKAFKQKIALTAHIGYHSDERKHKCDLCNKTYKTAANLYMHKILHTGIKSHVCSLCGASFSYKSTLNAHIKIHTGEKPYVCEVCSKTFAFEKNLRLHLRNVHSGTSFPEGRSSIWVTRKVLN